MENCFAWLHPKKWKSGSKRIPVVEVAVKEAAVKEAAGNTRR